MSAAAYEPEACKSTGLVCFVRLGGREDTVVGTQLPALLAAEVAFRSRQQAGVVVTDSRFFVSADDRCCFGVAVFAACAQVVPLVVPPSTIVVGQAEKKSNPHNDHVFFVAV